MNFKIVFATFATAVVLSSGAAPAQGLDAVINVATNTFFPPFEYKDTTTNKLTGFDIDIVEAIARKIGVKVNWVETSFEQQINSVATRRVDLALGLADRPERRDSVNFLDYWHDNAVFYTLRANAQNYPTTESVCGKRVAVARSSSAWMAATPKWSDEHCVKTGKPPVTVVGAQNTVDARVQLNQGRVDAAVLSAASLMYQNTIENDNYAVIGKEAMYSELQGMIFAKENTKLMESMRKAFDALIADGTYKALMWKWKIPESNAIQKATINGKP